MIFLIFPTVVMYFLLKQYNNFLLCSASFALNELLRHNVHDKFSLKCSHLH